MHRQRVGGDLWEVIDGLKVTSPERTVVDCLRAMSFQDGLAIADAAVRQGTSVEDLLWFADVLHGLKGVRQARYTAGYADGRSESGGESIARAAMIELGFVIPELQAPFDDPVTGRTIRVDFLWQRADGSQVLGELDGREKYVNPAMMRGRSTIDVLADERLRESHLSLSGAPIVRFSVADTYRMVSFARLLDSFGVPRVSSE